MSGESEEDLQKSFINQLVSNGFEFVDIGNEDELNSNFKNQISKFNDLDLDDSEFDELFIYLNSNSQDSYLKLNKLFRLSSKKKIKLIDFSDFSNNIFQVSEEISIYGKFNNRYDVLLLVNGIPIVEVELKKSGVDLKEAFGQIIRYKSDSHQNLLNFIQLFVISNKVETRYFLNEELLDYDNTQTFKDISNESINLLSEFTDLFLTPHNLLEIISKYIFIDYFTSNKVLLRPYQINAIKKIINQIKLKNNGYIWHTYGSGKTLTSLHLSMLLKQDENIDKIVYITRESLSKFPQDYVSKNSKQFLEKLNDEKLIITSINKVFTKDYAKSFEEFKDLNIVFIFDEYEKRYFRWNPLYLMNIFKNSLFYCFTGAPIFDENIKYDLTTKYIFGNRIDSYLFKDSLIDNNSLNIHVDYLDDEKNKKSLSNKRMHEIYENILKNFTKLTSNKKFNTILIVNSNQEVIQYYNLFKDSTLLTFPILRFNINEEFNGVLIKNYFIESLEKYNIQFNCDFQLTSSSLGSVSLFYEADVLEKMRNCEIDLLIVDKKMLDDQFQLDILSGFNSSYLNTVYVDADLDYENLIKVISLVNHPIGEDKLYGNIVLFKNLEDNLNNALKLFSNKNSKEDYKLKSLDYYKDDFDKSLKEISIDNSDDFINDFKYLDNLYTILTIFPNYNFSQDEIDNFNKIKSDYNIRLDNLKKSRKSMIDFNLSNIKKFNVDLEYIDSLFKVNEQPQKEDNETYNQTVNNFNFENKTFNTQFNQLNVSNETKNVVVNHFYIINPQNGDREELQLDSELEKSINSNKFIIEDKLINHDKNIHEFIRQKVPDRQIKPKFNIKDDFNICPNCNILYDLSYGKYCKKCASDLIPLKNNNYLTKVCPDCKLLYENESKACKKCGKDLIDLEDYLYTLNKICPKCQRRHTQDSKYCKVCATTLTDYKLYKNVNIQKLDLKPQELYNPIEKYENSLDSDNEIFTQSNYEKLKDFTLTSALYNQIIENIEFNSSNLLNGTINDNLIDVESLSIFEKILLFAKSFVSVEFKSSGSNLGVYELNQIQFEERDCNSQQISTLIHELSHHILFEIFNEIIMNIFNSKNSDDLEFFTAFTLGLGENCLMDEYCAHTVQGRFIPHGFQEYASFESLIGQFNIDEDKKIISYYTLAGNSFARDIIPIFEKYIDYELREDIKEQFNYDFNFLKKSDGILNEFDNVFDIDAKLKFIISTIKNSFKLACKYPENYNKLKYK